MGERTHWWRFDAYDATTGEHVCEGFNWFDRISAAEIHRIAGRIRPDAASITFVQAYVPTGTPRLSMPSSDASDAIEEQKHG